MLDVLELGFKEEATGGAVNRNKAVFHLAHPQEDFWYNYVSMEGAVQSLGVVALRMRSDVSGRRQVVVDGALQKSKIKFAGRPGYFCGLIFLFSAVSGELLAILNDGFIQHLRVAATSGLSVKYLARSESSVLGILGSGSMARSHAAAFAKIRGIRKIKMFSPNEGRRRLCAREMEEQLGVEVVPVDSPEQVFREADIVAACTNDHEGRPVKGKWLEAGQHITTVTREADNEVLSRIDYYCYYYTGASDHLHASQLPPLVWNGSRAEDFDEKRVRRDKVYWLPDLLVGRVRGREHDAEITFFTSEGTGVQFTATAWKVYELAREAGLGREIPTDWFLQTIAD